MDEEDRLGEQGVKAALACAQFPPRCADAAVHPVATVAAPPTVAAAACPPRRSGGRCRDCVSRRWTCSWPAARSADCRSATDPPW